MVFVVCGGLWPLYEQCWLMQKCDEDDVMVVCFYEEEEKTDSEVVDRESFFRRE